MTGHSVPPPPFAWDKIERELDKTGPRRNKYALFFITLAACAAGITIGVLTFININLNNLNNNIAEVEINRTPSHTSEDAIANHTQSENTDNKINGKTELENGMRFSAGKNNSDSEINNDSDAQQNKNTLVNPGRPGKSIQKHKPKKLQNFAHGTASNKLSAKIVKPGILQNIERNKPDFTKNVAATQDEIAENENLAVNNKNITDPDKNASEAKTDSTLAISSADSVTGLAINDSAGVKKNTGKDKKFLDANKNNGKWSFGIHGAAGISYRHITEGGNNITQDLLTTQSLNRPRNFNGYESDDKAVFSFSAGLSAGYRLSRHFSLQSGFYYAKNGYSSKVTFYSVSSAAVQDTTMPITNTDTSSFSQTDIGNEKGTAGDYNFSNTENASSGGNAMQITKTVKPVYNYYEWIRIPLQVRYSSAAAGKVSWFVQPGISANFLLNKYAVMVHEHNGTHEKQLGRIVSNYNNFGIRANLGVGVGFALGKDISLELRPEFEYSLRSLINNADYGLHPYTFQLNAGLVKRF